MKWCSLLFFIFYINVAFAADIEPQGTIDYTFPSANKALRSSALSSAPTIKIMKFKLSPKAREAIKRKGQLIPKQVTRKMSFQSASKQLGMNDVPVLDQGFFGSCVIFSEAAAINATIKKPNFVSPLCTLKLGEYIEKYAYELSGWNGSMHREMLARLDEHGIMTTEQQCSIGCAGMTEYPEDEEQKNSESMSFDAYHQLSLSLEDLHVKWSTILDVYQVVDENLDTRTVIEKIKNSINRGNRVLVSTFLSSVHLGVAGAVGSYHTLNDSWVLSSQIKRNFVTSFIVMGHAMVITGYDDIAIATDSEGQQHIGLFTLRNSWGSDRGDRGDFYMSYDYFRVLGDEAIAIGTWE